MQVDELRAELDAQTKSDTPAPALRVLIRAVDLAGAELEIVDLALDRPNQSKDQRNQPLKKRRDEAAKQLAELEAFLEQISANVGAKIDLDAMKLFEQIPDRMQQSVNLTEELRKLTSDATANCCQPAISRWP